jgi:predicted N-formylglutamate amidohydrolase
MSDSRAPLLQLQPGDPVPVEVCNPQGTSPVLLTCDHASRAVPQALGSLGLEDEALLHRHIAWDAGAADVAAHLSARFDATLIKGGYSRLVIDLNRHPGDTASIPETSDGYLIPANQRLSATQILQREELFFWPYHDAVDHATQRIRQRGQVPVLLSVHSFTPAPASNPAPRPWHVGVLWEGDTRISLPLLERLHEEPDLCVGDNKPYHARNPAGFTVDVHAVAHGYPHVTLEVRKDLINTPEGASRWAQRLGDILASVLADESIYRIETTPHVQGTQLHPRYRGGVSDRRPGVA